MVQRLDVGQYVSEPVAGHADLVGCEAVEHECVIGVGTMGDADLLNCSLCGGHDAVFLRQMMKGMMGRAVVLAIRRSCRERIRRGASEQESCRYLLLRRSLRSRPEGTVRWPSATRQERRDEVSWQTMWCR